MLSAPIVVRTVLAVPLVFVLPGAALLRAAKLRFAPLVQAPIMVGVSMATTVISGLVLDVLGGLSPVGWSAWLGGVCVLAASAAARHGATEPRPSLPIVRVRHVIMLATACFTLALTFIGALHDVRQYHPFDYTDFWMLPQQVGSDGFYQIGIKNGEGQPERVLVASDNRWADCGGMAEPEPRP